MNIDNENSLLQTAAALRQRAEDLLRAKSSDSNDQLTGHDALLYVDIAV